MIIDNKGRIFGKFNIVDLTFLAILILAVFIAIKFIFFKPNFFHYKNMTVKANFPWIPLSNLTHLSNGKNLFYLDNDSYLILSEEDFVSCIDQKKNIELIYYFNHSYLISAKTLTVNCTHDSKHLSDIYYFTEEYLNLPNTTSFNCNHSKNNKVLTYYFNDSYLTFPKKNLFDCSYDEKNISLVYYFDYSSLSNPEAKFIDCTYKKRNNTFVYFIGQIPGISEYICNATFLFKLKARILDDVPFYRNCEFPLLKGGHLSGKVLKVGGTLLDGGRIVTAHDTFYEKEGTQ